MTPGSNMRVICSVFVVPLVPAIKWVEARQQRAPCRRGCCSCWVARMAGKSDVEAGLPSDNQDETAFSSRLSRDTGYWDGREF
jgi:hypothetical protein